MSIGTVNSSSALVQSLVGQNTEETSSAENIMDGLIEEGGELNFLGQNLGSVAPSSTLQESLAVDPKINFEQLINSLKGDSLNPNKEVPTNKEIPLKKSDNLVVDKSQALFDITQNQSLDLSQGIHQDITQMPVLEKENERSFFPNSVSNKKNKNESLVNNKSEGRRPFFNPEIPLTNSATQNNVLTFPQDKEFKKPEAPNNTQFLTLPSAVNSQAEPLLQGPENLKQGPFVDTIGVESAEMSPATIEVELSRPSPAFVHNKKNVSNLYLKNSENLSKSYSSPYELNEVKDGVKLDSAPPIQMSNVRGRGIPASYKSESPFIQMKKSLVADQNTSAESNLSVNGENKFAVDSSSIKANNFNSLIINKDKSNIKTLDLSSVDRGDVTQIINRIANFIESNKITSKNGLDLIVRHEEIGEFKIHTKQSEQVGVVDLEIAGKSSKAHQFFSENENRLLQSLDAAGVKVGDFKISGPGHTLQLNNEPVFSSSSKSEFGSANHFSTGSGDSSRFSSDTFQGHQGGDRRKDLWRQAQEQYNDYYRNFQKNAA